MDGLRDRARICLQISGWRRGRRRAIEILCNELKVGMRLADARLTSAIGGSVLVSLGPNGTRREQELDSLAPSRWSHITTPASIETSKSANGASIPKLRSPARKSGQSDVAKTNACDGPLPELMLERVVDCVKLYDVVGQCSTSVPVHPGRHRYSG